MSKKSTSSTNQNTQGLYPIRTLSSLTGINAITLRAWERRYALIKPLRTPKGHRLYTKNDIDLVQQIMQLLDKGISIGQVRDYISQSDTASHPNAIADVWLTYQRRMVNAIMQFDTTHLDQTYNEALSLYPIDVMTERLILPLLKYLGERWEAAEGSIAEEHFFGAYLRNKLGARFHHTPVSHNKAKLVAACFPGESHEVGLMLFCLTALNRDYHIVYLGADTPLKELIEPVVRTQAHAVLLSSSLDPTPKVINEDLVKLTSSLNVPVFIGGDTAVKFRDEIVLARAIPLGTDSQFAIKRIDEELRSK